MTPEQALCVGVIRDGLRRAHQAATPVARAWHEWDVSVGLADIYDIEHVAVVFTMKAGDRVETATASVEDTLPTMERKLGVVVNRLSRSRTSATRGRDGEEVF
jgi:hypothetical protein